MMKALLLKVAPPIPPLSVLSKAAVSAETFTCC